VKCFIGTNVIISEGICSQTCGKTRRQIVLQVIDQYSAVSKSGSAHEG